jgi:hypothetical protein
MTNAHFKNCTDQWARCIAPCNEVSVFNLLTHSDQFVPEFMEATANITMDNYNPNKIWRFSNRAYGLTVSGRLQNWLDVDGSLTGRNERQIMGSTWANDWFRLSYDECYKAPDGMDMWICPDPNHAITLGSVVVLYDKSKFNNEIGSVVCSNGQGLPCPDIGYANHLWRSNLRDGLPFTLNSKFTGAIDSRLGAGWYIRWFEGAPKTITITNVQLQSDTTNLILAFPFPSGTTVQVKAYAASWCYPTDMRICSHSYQPVSSVEQLRNSISGDEYFYDTTIDVLYIVVVQELAYQLGSNGGWERSGPNPDAFTRNGITLPRAVDDFRIEISAVCTAAPNTVFCPLHDNFDISRTGAQYISVQGTSSFQFPSTAYTSTRPFLVSYKTIDYKSTHSTEDQTVPITRITTMSPSVHKLFSRVQSHSSSLSPISFCISIVFLTFFL